MTAQPLGAVAHHEAGHALAIIALGGEVHYATINADERDRSAGTVLTTKIMPGRSSYDRFFRTAIVAHAGGEAQRRSHPSSDVFHSQRGDLAQVVGLAAEIFGGAEATHGADFVACAALTFISRTQEHACRLIQQHWCAVEALASALLSRTSLAGFQVVQIAQRADPSIAIAEPRRLASTAADAALTRMRVRFKQASIV